MMVRDQKKLIEISQEILSILGDKYKLPHSQALEIMVNAVCVLIEMGACVDVDRSDSVEDVIQMICSYISKNNISVKNLQIIRLNDEKEVWH